eukprot:scaffold95677_cov33-Tisochrysis_lutea.AAC.2
MKMLVSCHDWALADLWKTRNTEHPNDHMYSYAARKKKGRGARSHGLLRQIYHQLCRHKEGT